jgi:hypothetical protein
MLHTAQLIYCHQPEILIIFQFDKLMRKTKEERERQIKEMATAPMLEGVSWLSRLNSLF